MFSTVIINIPDVIRKSKLLYVQLRYVHQLLNKKWSPEHSVFITVFGAGHVKDVTCKVLRKSMRGKKLGQVVLVTLN